MSFSVMFWNVENFGRNLEGTPDEAAFIERVDDVETHIRTIDGGNPPDVIGFSEIKDKVALRNLLMARLVEYEFAVTDGRQGIELLAGWRRDRFQQVVFTQRREFRAGSEFLRPGSLASVKLGDVFHNLLFLHTDSGRQNKDYENRQDMFEKIWSLKATLDQITADEDSRFVAMGDLNTMGRAQSGARQAITGAEEIAALSQDAVDNGMRLLDKNQSVTWRGSNLQSNLDHVLATANTSVENGFQQPGNGGPAEVSVNGWIDRQGQAQTEFAENVSDHCSLFFRVLGVPGAGGSDLVVSEALVNPVGEERGAETVTIRNRVDADVPLGGWTLRDRVGRVESLRGSVPALGSVEFGLTTARLANAGGTITLLDPQGVQVDHVSYDRADASQEGAPIIFRPADG